MNRDAPHELRKTSFALEMLHEGRLLNSWQGVYSDPTGQVHAARRQDLHCKIAGLAAQNRNKQVNGCRAQLARISSDRWLD